MNSRLALIYFIFVTVLDMCLTNQSNIFVSQFSIHVGRFLVLSVFILVSIEERASTFYLPPNGVVFKYICLHDIEKCAEILPHDKHTCSLM